MPKFFHSAQFKLEVIAEAQSRPNNIRPTALKYALQPGQIRRWKRNIDQLIEAAARSKLTIHKGPPREPRGRDQYEPSHLLRSDYDHDFEGRAYSSGQYSADPVSEGLGDSITVSSEDHEGEDLVNFDAEPDIPGGYSHIQSQTHSDEVVLTASVDLELSRAPIGEGSSSSSSEAVAPLRSLASHQRVTNADEFERTGQVGSASFTPVSSSLSSEPAPIHMFPSTETSEPSSPTRQGTKRKLDDYRPNSDDDSSEEGNNAETARNIVSNLQSQSTSEPLPHTGLQTLAIIGTMPSKLSWVEFIGSVNTFTHERERQMFSKPSAESGKPLYISDVLVGVVPPMVLPHVESHPDVFEVRDSSVRINASLDNEAIRTEKVEGVLKSWKERGIFGCLKGWRAERYAVWGQGGDVLMKVERSGAGLLGLRSYGCHVNGYVVDEQTGEMSMWVARRFDIDMSFKSADKTLVTLRSFTKQTYPGMLDNLVGGGLPFGIDPTANIVKECYEEAGMTSEVTARRLRATSVISFWTDSPDRGYLPDTEYVYDIQLDKDWSPNCQDGEVHGFMLMTLNEVMDKVRNQEFMPESGLCVLDFLLRHGHLDPSSEPDYLRILTGLRRELPFPGPQYGQSQK
ncbi:hypothetical protein HDU76_006780 [Blyttiomyces sp. JEL0837]|nr:hypothetical protein HDU76_006780 [Blyttiomyces sp. JEL0837]